MGVRLTRLLAGTKKLTMQEVKAGTKFKDVIGYSGAYGTALNFRSRTAAWFRRSWIIFLRPGAAFLRIFQLRTHCGLIPICWVTGQAAGVAAALSIKDKCKPREVNAAKLQSILRQQGAYLG